jgi:hypothetical protein
MEVCESVGCPLNIPIHLIHGIRHHIAQHELLASYMALLFTKGMV